MLAVFFFEVFFRKLAFGRPEVVRRVLEPARLTYPCVYLIKTGLPGPTPTAEEQVGYSIADVVAKAVFGIMIWKVADTKSYVEEQQGLLA